MSRSRVTRAPTLGLLAVTAAWGSIFCLLKDVLDRVTVSDFLAVRFAVAAAVSWLVAPRCIARLTPAERWYGVAHVGPVLVRPGARRPGLTSRALPAGSRGRHSPGRPARR